MRNNFFMSFFITTAMAALVTACVSPPAATVIANGVRRVTTPAGDLVVREAGSGQRTLVLWHALYADPSMFEPLVERLAPDYRLLIVTAPGHGQSGLPEGALTSAASGAAVLAILDAYGIDHAMVVGCSWGSIAGIQAARQAPNRISAVAAFNTPFGSGEKDIRTRMIVWMTGWLGSTEFFGRQVATGFFSSKTRKDKPEVVEQFVSLFAARNQANLQVAARAVLMERESLLPLLPEVRVPVRVIAGADDLRYPPSEVEEATRKMPQARFVLVKDSAHLTPLEYPDFSAQLIRELVVSLSESGT